MEGLSGQIAVVPGAARGLGAAIGRRLAAMGATVVLTARDDAKLKEVAKEIQGAGGEAETAEKAIWAGEAASFVTGLESASDVVRDLVADAAGVLRARPAELVRDR